MRDEILQCDNTGRALHLLFNMPTVTRYQTGPYDYFYGSGRRVTITLQGGYEHSFAGYKSLLEYTKDAAMFVYKKYIKNVSR